MEEKKPYKIRTGYVVVRDDGYPYLSTFTDATEASYQNIRSCTDQFLRAEDCNPFVRWFRQRHYWSYYQWRGYRIEKIQLVLKSE